MGGLTVFLTGAGRGLGAALAEALAKRGDNVFAGFHPGQTPPMWGVTPVSLDVCSEASVSAAAAFIAGHTRHLDVVLNVAGILGIFDATLSDPLDATDMHRVYDVNAVGPLRVASALLPLLLGGRTRVVMNVSSEAGSVGGCGRDAWYAYCMSKAALNMASAIMHNTLRPLGGCVVVVHPGWVRTWMRGHLDVEADLSPEVSAAGVLAQVGRALDGDPLFFQATPAFIDWKGDPLPW